MILEKLKPEKDSEDSEDSEDKEPEVDLGGDGTGDWEAINAKYVCLSGLQNTKYENLSAYFTNIEYESYKSNYELIRDKVEDSSFESQSEYTTKNIVSGTTENIPHGIFFKYADTRCIFTIFNIYINILNLYYLYVGRIF